MNKPMRIIRSIALCTAALLIGLSASCDKSSGGGGTTPGASAPIKIGFIIKDPGERWFQMEWKFAEQAAKDKGFTLIQVDARDGDRALSSIDTLAAQGAQGLVICTPDVNLGPALVNKAKADNLKIMSVDDQFLDADGKPMADVHHLGISATNIGRSVGKALYDQLTARGWTAADTAVCVVTFEELPTSRQRTDGEIAALTEAGFPKDRIFKGAELKPDLASSIDATNIVLTQHTDVKHWLICSMNDTGAIGAVRATETRGLAADSVCAIGINGTEAVNEFKKTTPTGLWGSILLQAKKHGYDTSTMMYEWIKDGKEPPLITYTEGILITRENYEKVMKDAGALD